MNPTFQKLQHHAPFNQFPQQSLQQIASMGRSHTFQAGEFVAHYGDAWANMAFVERGSLEAVKESPEGRSLLVYKLSAGEVMWGLTFFNEAVVMPVSLRAAEASTLLIWTSEAIKPILLEQGPALWSICSILIQRVQVASAIVENLAFQPVASRLAKMLIETYGGRGSEPLSRDLTLDEMAARVGTTREMVCRILYKFADQKWIDITRTEFRLLDPEGLEDLAGRKA